MIDLTVADSRISVFQYYVVGMVIIGYSAMNNPQFVADLGHFVFAKHRQLPEHWVVTRSNLVVCDGVQTDAVIQRRLLN